MSRSAMTAVEICRLLAKIAFAPSCVDMAWEWEAEPFYAQIGLAGAAAPSGFRIRATFRRPDRETGILDRGYGRWWEVPLDVTESGIVKTAFAAAKLIIEHELMESFHYDGVRIFDPHHDIEDLFAAAEHRVARELKSA